MQQAKTALVIVDMQNDAVLPGAPMHIAGAPETLPRIRRLLDWFHERDLPVFHVIREYRADGSDIEITRLADYLKGVAYLTPGSRGAQVVAEIAPSGKDYVVVKNRFSGFMNTELDFILRRLKVERLVICGTQYPNCIRATIYDAVSLGYEVVNITDATSAKTPEVKAANIADIRNIGVRCIPLDEFLNSPG
ncbi:MAG: N-carbamoylsarcosine amidase [Phycisphaerae bacterium]|nr:N-carbamoylsarcosine amidase [Phycisphaerae bacterium]